MGKTTKPKPEHTIKLVAVTEAYGKRFQKNAKAHDIGLITLSIVRHGFRAVPVYDQTLTAIVAGNGRIDAVYQLYQIVSGGQKYDTGEFVVTLDSPPKGIVESGGMWYIPVIYGVDADTIQDAIGYVIDDNNSTIMGGPGVTAIDAYRSWEDGYLDLLQVALSDTESVTAEDYSLMRQIAEMGAEIEDKGDSEPGESLPVLKIPFDDKAFRDEVETLFYKLCAAAGDITPGEFLAEVLESYG